MPTVIRESQKIASQENPDQLFDYAINRIEVDDERTKLTLYMRNGNSFNGLLDAIKKLLVLEQSDSRFEMPFKAFMYKKQLAFTIERDLKFALVYIKDCKAMSEKTYNLVRSVLKTPAPAPERLFSTMNLYN